MKRTIKHKKENIGNTLSWGETKMNEEQKQIEEKIQELEGALKEDLPKEELEQLVEELNQLLEDYLESKN